MLSIRMLKLCGESIYKPLNLIFKSCLETGQFPSGWKKANVVPVFKKSDKQLLKDYRPISLLSITGKIFERLLYTLESRIIVLPPPIVNFLIFFHPGHLYSNPPYY